MSRLRQPLGPEEGRSHVRAVLERLLRAFCETSYRRAAEASTRGPFGHDPPATGPGGPTGPSDRRASRRRGLRLGATGIPGREEGERDLADRLDEQEISWKIHAVELAREIRELNRRFENGGPGRPYTSRARR